MTKHTLFEKDNYIGKAIYYQDAKYWYGELELKEGQIKCLTTFGGKTREKARRDFLFSIKLYEKSMAEMTAGRKKLGLE